MSNFTKFEIKNLIEKTGVVPVFYHPDLETCRGVLQAAYDAGYRVFEFTNRGENAFEIFLNLRKLVDTRLPGMALGIGTITNAHDTRKFLQARADFIVSPIFKKEMANECNKGFKLFIPGCGTLTEIVEAHDAGALIVKVFPAGVLGPKFVSSVKEALPWLTLMPTGGVNPTEENMKEWFDAGVIAVGLGSKLFDKAALESKDFNTIRDSMSNALKIAEKIRSSSKK